MHPKPSVNSGSKQKWQAWRVDAAHRTYTSIRQEEGEVHDESASWDSNQGHARNVAERAQILMQRYITTQAQQHAKDDAASWKGAAVAIWRVATRLQW